MFLLLHFWRSYNGLFLSIDFNFICRIYYFCKWEDDELLIFIFEVFGVWGAMATPAIAILVLSFLFSFLLIFFLPILLGLATTYMSISIIVAIVKLDNGGLDPIYTLLIANVLIGIATFIVLWSYISTIIQTFTQGLTGL